LPGKEATMQNFADRLLEAVERKGTPAVVGIDPRLDLLPPEVVAPFRRRGPLDCAGAAQAFEAFGREIIDLTAPHVPAVKPQVAFFEQFGWPGYKAYQDLVLYAQQRGLLVIGDVKRGDISTTAAAYADGHLGRVAIDGTDATVIGADAVTINPYLGSDSVEPFLQAAHDFGKGLFVLVRTSNKSAAELQDLRADGRPIYLHVADLVRRWGESLVGKQGYSSVGAVVGATGGAAIAEARQAMPGVPFLVPGYGAQGATAADLAPAFDHRGRGALVNSSRGIIFAWTQSPYKESFGLPRWREAVLAALHAMRKELASASPCADAPR
jgi:orotidine-5'-phosphate decarboxylase